MIPNCDKTSSDSELLFDVTTSTIAASFAVFCSICGIIGNSITLFTLFGSIVLRQHSTTPFLASLGISDLIFSLFNLPLLAHRFFTRDWTLGQGACIAFPFLLYANVAVSSLSMMLISINRSVGIYFPESFDRNFTRSRSVICTLGVWIFSLSAMSFPIFGKGGQYGYVNATFSCTFLPNKDTFTWLIVYSILFVLVPCTVLITSYGAILYKVCSTGNAVRLSITRTDHKPNFHQKSQTRERELTKTFLIICACYVICYIPASVLMVFDPMPPCSKNPGWHVFGYVMFWFSTIVNPIVYVVANRHYRKFLMRKVKTLFNMDSKDHTTTFEDSPRPRSGSGVKFRFKLYPLLPQERKKGCSDQLWQWEPGTLARFNESPTPTSSEGNAKPWLEKGFQLQIPIKNSTS